MAKLRLFLTLTLLLFFLCSAVVAQTSLQAQITLRPLTRDDIATYKLPASTQIAAGLSTVALGQPAYLEVLINKAIPAAQISGVTWTLTSKPTNSNATLIDGPLDSSVLAFEPADQSAYQVAGRKLLKPDVAGRYTVTATVTTSSAGSATLTQRISAATYTGVRSCRMCHDGGLTADKVTSWSKTGHATIFREGINGTNSDHYAQNCIACHTVGYDANTDAANGSFSAVAQQLKWTFPTPKAGNYEALPEALKNLGDIQCENCHGPGSLHASSGGDTALISVGSVNGVCAQCHGAMTHHFKMGEYNSSRHAVATSSASGAGREGCVGCHTGVGFVAKVKGGATTTTAYTAINCLTCHDPHGTNAVEGDHLVRPTSVTLAEGTVVEEAGKGALCMNCHQARVNASTYVSSTPGSARFGPHHGPQADMLMGVNAVTYGKEIPSSAHGFVVEDSCVHCHMQEVPESGETFTKAGGHTFWASVPATDTTAKIDLIGACQQCHGRNLKEFDFTLFDYNGDGQIEGVQTEVQHLLDQLSSMLPPNNKPKTSLAIDATWTPKQLQAAYNWLFVTEDRSKGVHNTAYTVGILKASIADLSAK